METPAGFAPSAVDASLQGPACRQTLRRAAGKAHLNIPPLALFIPHYAPMKELRQRHRDALTPSKESIVLRHGPLGVGFTLAEERSNPLAQSRLGRLKRSGYCEGHLRFSRKVAVSGSPPSKVTIVTTLENIECLFSPSNSQAISLS